jgi:hypothetical protein
MAVNLAMLGNGFQFLGTDGAPLNAGKLYTYQAGSSTPLATYTTINGDIANTNPIILGTDGRPPEEIWLTEGYFYKFILKDSDDVTIATYDNIYGALSTAPAVAGDTVPAGCILLWSGSIGSIPVGWYLCNGSNGTPDLRDKFVVGAGSAYAVNGTGGSANAIVVSHTHTATSVVTDPQHNHDTVIPTSTSGNNGEALLGTASGSTTTITSSTEATGITVATTIDTAGTSGTNANLPPYYALCYIMKA